MVRKIAIQFPQGEARMRSYPKLLNASSEKGKGKFLAPTTAQ
jgi:hypothetical protein